MRSKLKELINRINKELAFAERYVLKNQKSANLIGEGMASGYSIAGDLEHARNTAILSENRIGELRKLKKEIVLIANRLVNTINPPCFVVVKFKSGVTKEFYFVDNPVYISGLNLISPDSPIGRALVNKRVADSFNYSLPDGQVLSGKIILIG